MTDNGDPHFVDKAVLEKGSRLGAEIMQAVGEYQEQSPRTVKGAAGFLGFSDLGACREYVRSTVTKAEKTPFKGPLKWEAFIGTQVGDGMETAVKWKFKNKVATQLQLKLDLGDGITVEGSSDIVWIGDDAVVDLKGLALDTPIPTPTGWTTMGAVQVGDLVLDMDGKPAPVVAKTPVKNIDCYRVSFNRGTESVICDENHVWWSRTHGLGGALRERGVKSLVGKKGYTVPLGGLVGQERELPIDPWYLGYWLGNGNRCDANSVTCGVDDASEINSFCERSGRGGRIIEYVRGSGSSANIRTQKLPHGGSDRRADPRNQEFADAGLIGNKHIPAEYMRASRRQREELVRGLMDSDGSWNRPRKRAVFSVVDQRLRDSLAEVLVSLGERLQTNSWETEGFGRVTDIHSVEWTPRTFNPFRLSRKAQLCDVRKTKMNQAHSISRVEAVESVPTQCIVVDSDTSSFLCGKAMIPTHNCKDGLATVRRDGPSLQNWIQISGYLVACIQMGKLTENATAHLVYYDRSGKDKQTHVASIDFELALEYLDVARARLKDVEVAIDTGEVSPAWLKDEPPSYCLAIGCPYYVACWGDSVPGGEITDPELIKAVDTIAQVRGDRKRDTQLENEAKAKLRVEDNAGETHLVEGFTPTKHVQWTLRQGADRVTETLHVRDREAVPPQIADKK